MEKLHISFHTHHEHCEVDWNTGAIKPPEKATKTIVAMPCELTVRGLRQGFLVEGSIKGRGFDTDEAAKKLRATVLDWIPRRRIWALFRMTEIQMEASDRGEEECEAEIEVSEDVAVHLEQQAKLGIAATAYLRKTVEELREAANDPVYYRQTIQRGLGLLRRFSAAAGEPMMGAWRREKLGIVELAFSKLATRKNPNHPNYIQWCDSIESALAHWPATNLWIEEPPQAPL